MRRFLSVRLAGNLANALRGQFQRHGVWGFARRLPYYLRNSATYLRLLGVSPAKEDELDFSGAAAGILREVRVHPDLEGGGDTLAAKVSVVIPTLNAGPEFSWLLRKLRSQRAVREMEIVIVDSGSTDSTVETARAAGARVIEILPSEFSHSHARNLGAAAAAGEYLLFMVQDAYPIGDFWLYGMLRYLLDHGDDKLAAVSCAEYSRGDSDMMYDSMIDTHYRFLGCLEHDRLAAFAGNDQLSLRTRGQLSDVACLIPTDLFSRYRYRGNYAEDLDLGIRLIKDGWRVAMLASIKVVHSHNRPSHYYLKRTFVDVVFLAALFEDFTYPQCRSLPGLAAGLLATAAHVSRWLRRDSQSPPAGLLTDELAGWIRDSRASLWKGWPAGEVDLDDPRLSDFVARFAQRFAPEAGAALEGESFDESRRFADIFLARLEHFQRFAAHVYGERDAMLGNELRAVVCKSFAAAAGAALAYFYLANSSGEGAGGAAARAIYDELTAGI